MKTSLYALFLLVICNSCNEGGEEQKTVYIRDTTVQDTQVQDTVIFIKDSTMATAFADSLPSGAYQGVFPCKGCEGVQQTIVFKDDKSYRQEQIVWSKNSMPETSEGTWKLKDGKIELSQNSKTAVILIKRKDTLFGININGVPVNDSSKYMLTKRKLASINPAWDKKRSEGIDFAGLGNEPFWNLEIDNEKFILFKLAEWKKPVIAPVEKPVTNKDSIFYDIKKDSTRWTITIFPQFCSDGMSDYLYQYKVNINYKGALYKGCGIMLDKKAIQ